MQLISLCVVSKQSWDCRKRGLELSPEGQTKVPLLPREGYGFGLTVKRGQNRTGQAGGLARGTDPAHGDQRHGPAHASARPARAIRSTRDTRGGGGSFCQLREPPGLLPGTKGLVWGNFQTLRQNRTQLMEKDTDSVPVSAPPSQVVAPDFSKRKYRMPT